MSINAAKGVEIGAGFEAAALSGEENADEMRMGNDGLICPTAGRGILASPPADRSPASPSRPTSSILTPRLSINQDGEEIEIRTKGRHDPCVGIRAVPVVEAMVAWCPADAFPLPGAGGRRELVQTPQSFRAGSDWRTWFAFYKDSLGLARELHVALIGLEEGHPDLAPLAPAENSPES